MKKNYIAAGFGLLFGVLVFLGALTCLSSVQTRLARRLIPASTNIGQVSVGLHETTFSDLHFGGPGWVLNVPSATVQTPVWPLLRKNFQLLRVVAHGWTLDLSGPGDLKNALSASRTLSNPPSISGGVSGKADTLEPADVFEGILPRLTLPVDLSVDQVDLEGEIIFHTRAGGSPRIAHLLVTGGGLKEKQVGRFEITGSVATNAAEPAVQKVSTRASFEVGLLTPREFSEFSLTAQIGAEGPQLALGSGLALKLRVVRAAQKEHYSFSLQSFTDQAAKQMISAEGEFPDKKGRLSGVWLLDGRDTDLLPFALGLRLPQFVAKAEGRFDGNSVFDEIHASGSVEGTLSQWEVFSPVLAPVGRVHLQSDFDLREQGRTFRIDRLSLKGDADQPAFLLQTLQGIEIDAVTGELKVLDPSRDLVQLKVSVPVVWLHMVWPGLGFAGNVMRGEVIGTPREGGLAFRSVSPWSIARLQLTSGDQPLLRNTDVSFLVQGSYSATAEQIEVADLTLQTQNRRYFSGTIKAGKSRNGLSTLKTTGHYSWEWPAAAEQPIFSRWMNFDKGTAEGDFSAIFGRDLKQLEGELRLKDLRVRPNELELPSSALEFRADLQSDGLIKVEVPFHVARDQHATDGKVSADIRPDGQTHVIDAALTSESLSVEDLVAVYRAWEIGLNSADLPPAKLPAQTAIDAATISNLANSTPAKPDPTIQLAPWRGIRGKIKLGVKNLFSASGLQGTNVSGEISLEPRLKVLNLEAKLPAQGAATLSAGLSFDAKSEHPFSLEGTLHASHLDLNRYLDGANQIALVDGSFDLALSFSGTSDSMERLSDELTESAKLTARGGSFRGFAGSASAVDLEKFQKNASTVGAIFQAAAGMVGYGENVSYSEKLKAAGDALRRFSNIDFDQLKLELIHQPGQPAKVVDLGLISPEFRVTGSGFIDTEQSPNWRDFPWHLTVAIGVRGEQANNLKKLGLVGIESDPLGYVPLLNTFPLEGTIDHLSADGLTRSFNRALSK